MPQGSILDLVNSWTPHPDYPGIYRFTTKYGVVGFVRDDPTCLHFVELNGPRLDPKKAGSGWPYMAMLFEGVMKLNYPLVLVERVVNPTLINLMIDSGWLLCHIRRIEGPGWHPGAAWMPGYSRPVYEYMSKDEDRRWQKLGLYSRKKWVLPQK